MGVDDLRSYVQMATGLTEATTGKAKEVVSALLAQGMSLGSKATPSTQMVGQVQELADNLVTTSRDNRELLVGMIRSEVDKAVGRMGFVREDELAALRRHVERVERQVTEMSAELAAATAAAPAPPAAEQTAADAPVADLPPAQAQPAEEPAGVEVPKKKKKKIVVDPGVDS